MEVVVQVVALWLLINAAVVAVAMARGRRIERAYRSAVDSMVRDAEWYANRGGAPVRMTRR